ncbi:hypothetical protein [Micromonospora schwarzwaldensis]
MRALRRAPPRSAALRRAPPRSAALRRAPPRPGRDVFERGRGVPDRHSAAIVENAVYGDAASFDSGGGGGDD